MKSLICAALIMFAACKSKPAIPEQKPVPPRKAAIAEQMLFDIYTLHFDIKTPPGHPSKIEEYIIKGWEGQKKDTIKREYIFENDRLVKVFDNEFGQNWTYILKYDNKGRCILIDQQGTNGSFHKDTFLYPVKGPFASIREHFMFDKSEERLSFNYYGNTDSLLISSTEGPEICHFSELNDTLFVTRVWRDPSSVILSNRIEAYDKNNRRFRVTYIENRHVDRIINFTYDEHGNQLSRVDEDGDNIIGGNTGMLVVSKPDMHLATYEYDSRDNWTRKTEKNGSGKYNAVTTRRISYVQ